VSVTASTVYTTSDGSRFDEPQRAEKYQTISKRLDAILDQLKPVPSSFNNGDWVQQHGMVAERVASQILGILSEKYPGQKWIAQTIEKGLREAHPSWVGRLISDGDNKAENRAWGRICRINWQTYREYNQPYFADRPEKADGREVAL
jgi:hypothetical protein